MVFYPNLAGEIAKKGLKKGEIAKHLNISTKALNNKLAGKSPFTWPEVQAIQRRFFPDVSLEQLFDRETGQQQTD